MKKYDIDLWTYLKRHDHKTLPIWERLRLAKDFVEEIEKLKHTWICHRDIKLSNILLNLQKNDLYNGEMVLTDFGILCLADEHVNYQG